MTRLRGFGLVCIVAGMLLGFLAQHPRSELQNGPFGDGLGSLAFPEPWELQSISFCAVATLGLGLMLTVRDSVKWIRNRCNDHEPTN